MKKLVINITTDKACSKCKNPLSNSLLYNTEIDYCSGCLGSWFEEDELRFAKDQKDKDLRWFDIDLWKDTRKFKVSNGARFCPCCRMPLYEVYYGNSGIIVDVCNICHGVWLDRAEFKKITLWLKHESEARILHRYVKNLFNQTADIFVGPESMRDEILDFLTVFNLLGNKFVAQHPTLSRLILQLPR